MLHGVIANAIAAASFLAFLSTLSVFVRLPALAGPAVGILAKSPPYAPSLPAIVGLQLDVACLARRSSDYLVAYTEQIADFNVALDDLVALVDGNLPECDKKIEVLRLLFDLRRSSVKSLVGVTEFTNVLYGSAKGFMDAIELPPKPKINFEAFSIRNHFACLFRFDACPIQWPRLQRSQEHTLTALSDECHTALGILDRVHAELLSIVDDFWPRLDHLFILHDDLAWDDHTRRAFANFTFVARNFFAFAAAIEYKMTPYYLALSRTREAVEGLLA